MLRYARCMLIAAAVVSGRAYCLCWGFPFCATGIRAEAMEQALLQRAARVRQPGAYIGFFEWLAFRSVRAFNVQMLFGSSVVDLGEVFGGSVPMVAELSVARVVATKVSGPKLLSAVVPGSHLPDVNHYVIGIAAKGSAEPVAEWPLSLAPAESYCLTASAAAMKAGWQLRATQSAGDCGIDCMSYFAGLSRTPFVWRELRRELADFMGAVAGDIGWQNAFGVCQENDTAYQHLALAEIPPPPAGESSGAGPPALGSLEAGELAEQHGITKLAGVLQKYFEQYQIGNHSFAGWISQLPLYDRRFLTASYAVFEAARKMYDLLARPVRLHPQTEVDSKAIVPTCLPSAASTRTVTFLRDRVRVGKAYQAWLAAFSDVGPPRDHLRRFLREHFRGDPSGKASVKDVSWLRRCIKQAIVADAQNETRTILQHGGALGRFQKGKARMVGNSRVKAVRGKRGRKFKCPALRTALWDWFVDTRASIATAISPKFMLFQAKHLATLCLKAMAERNEWQDIGVIDAQWLYRFRMDMHIVLRKPNRRYKVSWPTACERCVADWKNVFKVRRLAEIFLGKDLSDAIFGVDEKPLHFNETASKEVATLTHAGAPFVKLRTNHSASRERLTLMTMVTSWRQFARSKRRPPIELMFKSKSAKVLAEMELPKNLNISLQWSYSGSYDQARFLAYLECWLEPWTEARAEQKDYRILYTDVASGHLGKEVSELCWERGYVYLLHYGGTTSILQVNDTTCHGEFEQIYLELEQAAFTKRHLAEPGNISRSRQEVLNDVTTAWQSMDHTRSVKGHLRTALSVRLDGTEDHEITGEAREIWVATDMAEIRRQALAEVDAAVDAGVLTSFLDVHKVIRGFGWEGES